MKDDNDLPYILQCIGVLTLFGIFVFMLFCTVNQIDSWAKNPKSTCEVTVQKE